MNEQGKAFFKFRPFWLEPHKRSQLPAWSEIFTREFRPAVIGSSEKLRVESD